MSKYIVLLSFVMCGLFQQQLQEQREKITSLEVTVDYLADAALLREPEFVPSNQEIIKGKIRVVLSQYHEARPIDPSELDIIAESINEYSQAYKVPDDLMIALFAQESLFDHNALSRKGAIGIGQMMPATARAMAKELDRDEYDITSIQDNIQFSTKYMQKMLHLFGGNTGLAVRAYNAGPSKVMRVLKGKSSSFALETIVYHKRITKAYAMIY